MAILNVYVPEKNLTNKFHKPLRWKHTYIQVCDVYPLAVDVVIINVFASCRDALVTIVLTIIVGFNAFTVIVLQAERCLHCNIVVNLWNFSCVVVHLMTLYNAPSPLVHDLEVGEDLHGMVMLMAGMPVPGQFGNGRSEVCGARIGDGSGEPGTRSQ